MQKLTIALASAVMAATTAQADFGTSAAQMAAILASKEARAAILDQTLRSIENTGTRADGASEWLLRAQECDVTLYVVEAPGPIYSVDQVGKCG